MASVPKYLFDERDRLEEEVARLYEAAEAARYRLDGLNLAIGLIKKGENPEASTLKDAENIKGLLLGLAREVKGDGLNANIAVELAAKRGVALKRGTAASNLSRLKTDNALVHDGQRYRLPEFVRSKSSGGTVTASGINPGFGVAGTVSTVTGTVGVASSDMTFASEAGRKANS
jgi:hypothetical protein